MLIEDARNKTWNKFKARQVYFDEYRRVHNILDARQEYFSEAFEYALDTAENAQGCANNDNNTRSQLPTAIDASIKVVGQEAKKDPTLPEAARIVALPLPMPILPSLQP